MTDMMPSSLERKSWLSVDEYELPPDYGNHKTETDSNSEKLMGVTEDIH